MSANAIVADFGERPAWRVPGAKALPFLHDMLSQDCAGLMPGHGALAALLSEKGRVRAIVRVLATQDGALIDADPAAAPAIELGLERIAPLGGADMQREPRRLIRLLGEPPEDIAGALGTAEHDHIEHDHARIIRTRWGGVGIDLLAEPQAAETWLARLGGHATVADPGAFESARIRDGRPTYGVDVDDSILINETPLLQRAVSFTKGCYPGQESVARVHNLGAIKRRIAVVGIEGDVPAAGTRLTQGDADVGVIRSAAREDGGGVALALIDAAVEQGEQLTAGGSTARVV